MGKSAGNLVILEGFGANADAIVMGKDHVLSAQFILGLHYG